MEDPKFSHWKVGKRILRYIVCTMDYGIRYSTSEDDSLVGYTDTDFASSVDDRKGTYGYEFMFGTGLISWASKKQPIITISSAEAKYVEGPSTTCHAIWLRRILNDITYEEKDLTPMFCENNSTISLSNNHVFHHKSKHIDTSYHFIRDLVNDGSVMLQICGLKEQLTYIFTKPLGRNTFEF